MAERQVAATDGSDGPRLAEIFDTVWKTWEYVEKTNDPSVSEVFQKRVYDGVTGAETAVTMVNQLRLFTDNEDLEEVATNEIRYMLLPALLAYLQSKIVQDDRINAVKKSRLLHTDYLQICKSYGVTSTEIPVIPDPGDDINQSEARESATSRLTPALPSRPDARDLVAMNAKRQQKIDRYKQQKETEKRLHELKPLVEREHVDDEVKRDYYTMLLTRWVATSLEEIESMSQEIEILGHMAKMRASGTSQPQPPPKQTDKPQTAPGFRPFILTKSSLQKKVYGAGYPSLPSYTVEEFFDQQVALGNVPPPGAGPSAGPGGPDEAASREREDAEKEAKIDADDEETLQKARNWDDWTDDHRRGWGNTQNKG